MQKEKFCKTCVYFIQHYRKSKKNYYEVYCGHCTHLRVKKKTADTKSCTHYNEIPKHTKHPLHG